MRILEPNEHAGFVQMCQLIVPDCPISIKPTSSQVNDPNNRSGIKHTKVHHSAIAWDFQPHQKKPVRKLPFESGHFEIRDEST